MFRKGTFLAFRCASMAKSATVREKTIQLIANVQYFQHSQSVYPTIVCFRRFSISSNRCNAEDDIVNGFSPEVDKDKRLKILQLEMDVCRQEGRRAPNPDNIKPDQWEHILSLPSKTARWKYYIYLWQIEKRKENLVEKKEKLRQKRAEELEEAKQNDDGHIKYHLGANSMFLRVYQTTMDRWHNYKLIHAMQFGQKLVIDCSYDPHMITREAKNTAKQLMLMFADNRVNQDPFDLHICNANLNGETLKQLKKYIPTMLDPGFPLNVHTESYLDLFPKERLVYLTPHCRNDLTSYSHDDIYIVGAMVDKVNNEPLSLAKAKSQGLRMARLPLDHYLQWGSGSGKSLTINQMLSILLDMKQYEDWNKALVHVPRRKLADYQTEKPWQQKLDKFKEYQFEFETWGAKKLIDHSPKRVEKRLKSNINVSEILKH